MDRRKVFILVTAIAFLALPLSASGKKDATKTPTAPAPSPVVTSTPTPPPATTPPPAVRYYQSDGEIAYTYDDDNTMSNSGCCFMSCLGIAQTHSNRNLTAAQICVIRNQAISAGDLFSNFSVKNIPAVINKGFIQLGSALRASVIGITTSYEIIECDSTLIGGKQDNGKLHWVEGYPNGETYWNPHPTATITTITKIFYIRITGFK